MARKPKSRKQRRQEERRLKKARKHAFFCKSKNTTVKTTNAVKTVPSEKIKPKVEKKQKKTIKRKRELSPSVVRKKQLMEANELEDRNIRSLAKKLKLNKRKSKNLPRSFVDDGLDYILEACDTQKLEKSDKELEEVMDASDNNSNNASLDECEEMPECIDEEASDEAVSIKSDGDKSMNKEATSPLKQWEDIYGRLRNADGSVVKTGAVYTPPAKQTASFAEINVLKRRLKGLINRLSEANMQPVSTQIEELYMSNSRSNMNETLTSLLIEAICQQMLTPEKLIQEHAMLIALLHANVGSEIGAHILQNLVKKFNELHSMEIIIESKEIHNVLLLICHIYNFKIINCILIFDIIDVVTDSFSAQDIELLLLILRSVGFHLRKDDPVKLKETVLKTQAKASQAKDQEESRVCFMLETLMAIRNNNMSKIPNYDDSHVEHLKKLLRSLIRKGNTITQLQISLRDFLEVDKKGRWWLVGSAWENSSLNKDASKDTTTALSSHVDEINEEILEKARLQRMNTDVRRSIFCILMTAEDYLDCFEKLLHLGLKNQQEREIIVVILDCCLHESEFNPFYAFLAEKFCSFDRRFQIAFQFALWDQFKQLQNLTKAQIKVLAAFLASLFLTQSLSLSVLKVLYFAEMDKPLVEFLKAVFTHILIHEKLDTVLTVFQRIQFAKKLHLLRESVKLFLQHFMKIRKSLAPEEQQQIIQERILLVCPLLS